MSSNSSPTDQVPENIRTEKIPDYQSKILAECSQLETAISKWEAALASSESEKNLKVLVDNINRHKNVIELYKSSASLLRSVLVAVPEGNANLTDSVSSNEGHSGASKRHQLPNNLPEFAPRGKQNAFFDLEEYLENFELCLISHQTDVESWTYALLAATTNDVNLAKWIKDELLTKSWSEARNMLLAKLFNPLAQEHLEKKFKSMKPKPNESVAQYADAFLVMANRVGYSGKEKLIIKQFIQSMAPRYITVARNCGLNFQSIEEAATWAQTIESSVFFDDEEKKTESTPARLFCKFCKRSGHLEEGCLSKLRVSQTVAPKDLSRVTCRKCKETGHYASTCTSPAKPSLNMVEPTNEINQDYFYPFQVPILINGNEVYATLDTGAATSVISAKYCESAHFPLRKNRNPVTFKLAKKGTEFISKDNVFVHIKCGKHSTKMSIPLMDLQENTDFILGRDLFRKFHFCLGNIPYAFSEKKSQNIVVEDTVRKCTENPLEDSIRADFLKDIDPAIKENLLTSGKFCNLPESVVKLVTNDNKASFVRQYPLARKNQPAVDETVQGWIRAGVVKPTKVGCQWNSPLLAVQKKDSEGNLTSVRVCLDPRKINEKLIDDKYPIPDIKQLLGKIEGNCIFSTLDLVSSYHQFKIDDGDQEKTAFTWNNCQYMFVGAPFGIKTMTSVFQRVTSRLFGDMPFVCTYVDDILISSKTIEEHAAHTRMVLSRLSAANLTVNQDKCRFAYSTVKVLGHIVSKDGVSLDKKKLEIASNWTTPRTSDDVASLLGFLNYLRDHIPLYAKLTAPLEKLRHPPKALIGAQWTDECKEAFSSIKSIIAGAPMLSFPDFTKTFIVATDASNFGLGAVIFQTDLEDHKYSKDMDIQTLLNAKKFYINFASRSLSAGERNYSATKRELAGIVFALKRFHNLLWGTKFILFTDHRALTFIHSQRHTNPMINSWLDTILNYNFDVFHCPGIHNILPDALSRMFPSNAKGEDALASDILQISCRESVKNSPKPSRTACTVKHVEIQSSLLPALSDNRETTSLENERLFAMLKNKTSPPVAERKAILEKQHLLGHFGATAMFKSIWNMGHYWSDLRKDCIDTCRRCGACQQFTISKEGFHPLVPIAAKLPFDHVSIDLLGPMPTTPDGFNYILVLVDVCSRFTILRPLVDKSAESISKMLFQIFTDFGFPKILQSDNGKEFVNKIIEKLLQVSGVTKRLTSPYHPRANGLSERFIQTTLSILKKELFGNLQEWKSILPITQLMLNDKISTIHGSTPFAIMFARKVNPFHDYSNTKVEAVANSASFIQRLKFIQNILYPTIETKMLASQATSKKKFDESKNIVDFPVGSLVMIKNNTKANKFEASYEGPYRVLSKNKGGAYVLTNAAGVLLSKNISPNQMKLISGDTEDVYEVESIVDHKQVPGGTVYRTRWQNFSEEDDTWEPAESFHDTTTISDYYKRRFASGGEQCGEN